MLLKVGTAVTIEKDFIEDGEKYKSKVVDSGEDFVLIDYPSHIETKRTAFFMDGTQLLISFIDNKLSYVFKAEVTGRMNKGIPMLKLTYPGDEQLLKIQRREFVRVETAIDVSIDFDGVYRQFVAEDISAGGIAINLGSSETLEESQLVTMTIVLPYVNDEIKYIQSKAKAVRIWEKDGRRIASMQFTDIDLLNRQHIIRFCFERQIKERLSN